jgi:hypothetical protein
MSGTKEDRDALRSPEAHPQARSIAPAWPERGQRRVPPGRTAQNLRKLAKLISLPTPILAFDPEGNLYVCPAGKELKKYHRAFPKRDGLTKDGTMVYFARKQDCHACALKLQCCPNVPTRKIARSVHEAARDKARAIAKTEAYDVSCRERKKVEMLFAHLKRILRLGRLRLRGPHGAKDEFLLAATAQNLRKLAKLIPHPTPIFAT